jgi:hypothetical protein
MVDDQLLSPCGLYCGVCAVYYATRDNNEKLKERLVGVYQGRLPGSENLSVQDIHCEGCLSEKPFGFCKRCIVRDCVHNRGYTGCHECNEFPCRFIEEFPMPVGKKVIMRAIPQRREWGTQEWVEAEEARYICPECGHMLFRGVKRCNKCKTSVDLD